LGAPLPPQIVRTHVQFFPDMPAAEKALRRGDLNQVLVIPADYLVRGKLRRYARSSNLFSSADGRPISAWLVEGLAGRGLDSIRTARISRPTLGMDLYALNRNGVFELKDDRRELVDFMLPLAFAMLLGLSITVGGQYLLTGVAEEKESRILESILCTVTPEELLGGKLVGLGAAGLTLVGIWVAMGIPVFGAGAVLAKATLPAGIAFIALAYFLLAYLFYGSLMTGIGSVTNNMREAQQFGVWFSFLNFAPVIGMTLILARPGGPVATIMSLFPPTAATAMMLRLMAPSSVVPAWQIGISLTLLLLAAWLALAFSARVFRIGLLMYGKTPNLPEILRWAGRK
ncbi:MAG: ABC transporter permease, partial [Candidatus Eisenbacteria bacterium]